MSSEALQAQPEASAVANEQPAIRVRQLAKHYRLYDSPVSRLKEWCWRPLNRVLGRHLPPYFQPFTALQGIDLDIWPRQTVGIIGRNGSGKSTLLQLISGTLFASQGNIEVNGRVAALLELGAGFNPEFTGRENVYIYAAVMGLEREQVSQRFESIAAFADIGDFIDQPVKAYSSGMLVRLAFAVIAHVDADILIVDEALAVGDAFFVQKCMRFLRRFMEHGTVLFVSHDSAAVTNLCDRAVWLEQGRVRMEGSAKMLTEHYLAARYAEDGPAPEDNAAREASKPPQAPSHTYMPSPLDYHDARRDLVYASPWRNDLEIFTFDETQDSFGQGGGSILATALRDAKDRPLRWCIGGEPVALRVTCRAHQAMYQPIIGFLFKDRLGQTLFGDNTYLTRNDLSIEAGGDFEAEFTFVIPTLPRGQYSIAIALAEGTQQEHLQHQWIHDALVVESHASAAATGLIGIPMHHISLHTVSAPTPASSTVPKGTT